MMNFLQNLRDILGDKGVITSAAEREPFETDWRKISRDRAVAVALPARTEEVAAVVALCRGAGVKIVPQGGNTGLVAGGVPAGEAAQLVLSLRRMNRIRDFDPVGETITVEAGVTLLAVQEAAAEKGMMFPVSLGAEGTAQIGGVISTNAGGIQVVAYGNMRAQVLGLEVVLADGQIWHGLRALRKDNTGFDLKHLFIGGEGTVGVVTAAVLKLQPAVRERATALVGVRDLEAALEVFGALRGHAGAGLTMCEFISRRAMELAVRHVPGAKLPCEAPAYLLVEISAHVADERVEDKLLGALEAALRDGRAVDAVVAQSDRERLGFLKLREGVPEGEIVEGGSVKHDVSVPIGKIPETVRAIEALVAERYPDLRLNVFGHVGDGNLHVNLQPPAGRTLADLAERKAALTAEVEGIAVAQGGSFSAEHGIGQVRVPGMAAHKAAVELEMMRAVKRALDPDGVFNPGKVLPAAEM